MCTKLTCLFSLVLLLVGAGAARADLVSHWTLDEGAGTEIFDAVGGNDGTIVGDPTWIAGVNGGALEFHGDPTVYGGGDYIDCGNDASLDITGSLSIALWIRPDADDPEGKGTAGGETAPMAKADSAADPSWSWQVRYGWNSAEPFMGFQFNATPRTWVYVGRNLERHEWCHVACSYDGTTVKCYLNGEETGSATMSALVSSPASILIGSDGWGCDWLGAIDDVRIYDHGISESELLAAMATEPLVSAYGPSPRDGAMITQTAAVLKWQPGESVAKHEVYFGESYDEVSAATPDDADVFFGSLGITMLPVGAPGGPSPAGLVAGKTYYWRVDEVNDVNPDSPWRGNVWSFWVQPLTAWKPFPVEGMKYVDPDQDLTWETGQGAFFHTVYFGNSFDEVNDAVAGGWMIIDLPYDPGPLELDTTYYWRVDEFTGIATHTGQVWSFTTRGEGGGVKAEYFAGMDVAGAPVLTQTEGSIDHTWSDEVAAGMSDGVSARWTANLEAPFTEAYKLITTSDDGVRLWLDGREIISNWTDHGTVDNVAKVDLVAGQVYLIRMEWYDNTGGAVAQLSWESPTLARQIIPQGWLQLPLRATAPSPVHGAPHAVQTPVLSWTAGDEATGHHVYFGEDADAVAAADTTTAGIYRGQQSADSVTYGPGPLEWGKTYYWRVDEINPGSVLNGVVWSFTTADFLLVEDFESYDDDIDAGTAIFQTWIDGWENGTGSTVGYLEAVNATFGETAIVHDGYQSMPLDYNNVNAPYYSETERTWATPQNWTLNGVDTLTVYVQGKPSNGSDTLYVVLEDSAGRTAVAPHPDPDAVLALGWSEFSVPLSDFTGVDPTRIKKMYIGLGDRDNPTPGGAGLIFIDDIRVTKSGQ